MTRFCTKCGAINDEMAQYCTTCQAQLAPPIGSGYQPLQGVNMGAMTDWKAMGADKKLPAGILAILLGSLGVHKFILGYTTQGIILLCISVLSCGILAIVSNVIGIIEGIIYLTKSDEEFVRTYIQGQKGWF
ncbi:MAG TPA: NINE protein [Pyrinomonadaceae bacterium]|nr:NINE protein [Pyrinomonadaceae bacterium]